MHCQQIKALFSLCPYPNSFLRLSLIPISSVKSSLLCLSVLELLNFVICKLKSFLTNTLSYLEEQTPLCLLLPPSWRLNSQIQP